MAGRYKPYPEYKDSGVEWLGSIPVEWSKSFVKHWLVSSPCYGILKPDKYDGGDGVKVVRILDVSERAVLLDNLEIVSPLLSSEYSRTLIKRGDLIVSVVGTLGRSFICRDEHEGMNLSRALARMQVKDSRRTRYLQYVIDSNCFEDYVSVTCNGAAQKVLNMEDLSNWSIPSPDECALDKIANFLDHETAKIDTLIEKQQQLIQLLKEKRQAVISHAVTKGLSSLNGGPNAKLRDSGVEWLGEVPEHWIVAGFKKYLNSIVDYRGKTPEKHDSGVFLVTARNIKSGAINYDASQEYISEDDYESVMCRGKPKFGDLLFTTEAPLGEVASVDREDIALAQRVIKFDGQPGVLNNFYLKYLIMSKQFQQSLMMFSSGSTAPGIKAERFVYLRSLIPPLSEQLEIIDYIESAAKKIDNLIVKAIDGIEIIQERRTALISAAVTGKIDVRDWIAPPASPTNKEVVA